MPMAAIVRARRLLWWAAGADPVALAPTATGSIGSAVTAGSLDPGAGVASAADAAVVAPEGIMDAVAGDLAEGGKAGDTSCGE